MKKSELPYTRISSELNGQINELMDDFDALMKKANRFGLDIRLYPSSDSLVLYFNDDWPDTLLVDKKLSSEKRTDTTVEKPKDVPVTYEPLTDVNALSLEKKTVYDKLVRDEIPNLMVKSGLKVTYHAVDGDELKKRLKDKLIEEVNEFIEATDPKDIMEELADITEVLLAIKAEYRIFPGDLEAVRSKKYVEKGGFYNGYVLDSAE